MAVEKRSTYEVEQARNYYAARYARDGALEDGAARCCESLHTSLATAHACAVELGRGAIVVALRGGVEVSLTPDEHQQIRRLDRDRASEVRS